MLNVFLSKARFLDSFQTNCIRIWRDKFLEILFLISFSIIIVQLESYYPYLNPLPVKFRRLIHQDSKNKLLLARLMKLVFKKRVATNLIHIGGARLFFQVDQVHKKSNYNFFNLSMESESGKLTIQSDILMAFSPIVGIYTQHPDHVPSLCRAPSDF